MAAPETKEARTLVRTLGKGAKESTVSVTVFLKLKAPERLAPEWRQVDLKANNDSTLNVKVRCVCTGIKHIGAESMGSTQDFEVVWHVSKGFFPWAEVLSTTFKASCKGSEITN